MCSAGWVLLNEEKNSSQMLLYLFDFQNLWNSGGFEAQEKLTLRVTGGVCGAGARCLEQHGHVCPRVCETEDAAV